MAKRNILSDEGYRTATTGSEIHESEMEEDRIVQLAAKKIRDSKWLVELYTDPEDVIFDTDELPISGAIAGFRGRIEGGELEGEFVDFVAKRKGTGIQLIEAQTFTTVSKNNYQKFLSEY